MNLLEHYDKLPQDVRETIEVLEQEGNDYETLELARIGLIKRGYLLSYGLAGDVESLTKL